METKHVYKAQPVYSFAGKSKDPSSCTNVPGPGKYNGKIIFISYN